MYPSIYYKSWSRSLRIRRFRLSLQHTVITRYAIITHHIQRAETTGTGFGHHMQIDLRGPEVSVARHILCRTDIHPTFEQVCGE